MTKTTNRILLRICILIVLPLLFLNRAHAQLSYQFTALQSNFIALDNKSKVISPNIETGLSGNIKMPFNFIFENEAYSSFKISKNGWISLSNQTISGNEFFCFNKSFNYIKTPVIAGFATEIISDSIKIKLVGIKPNRRIIIEWKNIEIQNITNKNTACQIILFEDKSNIEFAYQNLNSFKNISQLVSIGLIGKESKSDFLCININKPKVIASYGLQNNSSLTLPKNNDLFRFEPMELPAESILKNGLIGWLKVDEEYIKTENNNQVFAWQNTVGPIQFEQSNIAQQPHYISADLKPKLFNHHSCISFSKEQNSRLEAEIDNLNSDKFQSYFIVKYNEIICGNNFKESRFFSFSKSINPFISKKTKLIIGDRFLTNENAISEVLFFNRKLNINEVKILKSYLALKYGISLNSKYKLKDYCLSNGSLIWQSDKNEGFNNSIAGICRDDNLNFYQTIATSNNDFDALSLSIKPFLIQNDTNPYDVNNYSYLMWGNNGFPSVFSDQQNNDKNLPKGIVYKMPCIYKLNKFNAEQSFSLAFEKSKLLGCNNFEALRIITDENESFENGKINEIKPIITQNQVIFNNIQDLKSTQFYLTLALTEPNGKSPTTVFEDGITQSDIISYDAVLPSGNSLKRKKALKSNR